MKSLKYSILSFRIMFLSFRINRLTKKRFKLSNKIVDLIGADVLERGSGTYEF